MPTILKFFLGHILTLWDVDIFENFLLFDKSNGIDTKILAKNHQYLGVNKALVNIRSLDDLEGRSEFTKAATKLNTQEANIYNKALVPIGFPTLLTDAGKVTGVIQRGAGRRITRLAALPSKDRVNKALEQHIDFLQEDILPEKRKNVGLEQVFQNIHENSAVRQIRHPCLQNFWKAKSKAEKQPRSLTK